ncbi:MAG: hypothetical protein QM778_04835 [Myxococcales bacterium]
MHHGLELQAVLTVLALTGCLVTMLGLGPLRGNEYDVLPVAKQYMDPHWLPRDWYLNRPAGYRWAFNVLAGTALKAWSFPQVVLLGRSLIFLAFSSAAVALCRACRVSLWLCLPWIYAYLPTQSLAAGEWVLKSLETKPFAYIAVVASLAALVRHRYRAMAAWLGLAVTFHALIGSYACLCTLGCLALKEHRAQWRRIAKSAWPGPLTGLPGLWVLVGYQVERGHDRNLVANGAQIYVELRVSHHVLPSAWSSRLWPLWLGVCVATALLLRRREARYRVVSQYVLVAAAIFCAGLVIWGLGWHTLLRFYWFRFGDTMIPLLTWFLLTMRLSDRYLASASIELGGSRRFSLAWIASAALGAATLSLYFLRGPAELFGEDVRRSWVLPGRRPTAVGSWIQRHTDPEASFLIDPILDSFYVDAERAAFVTFKHAPQAEQDLIEWETRLERLAGGAMPSAQGLAARAELDAAYRGMAGDEARQIALDYGLDYMLTENPWLPFPRAYQSDGWTLYRMPRR